MLIPFQYLSYKDFPTLCSNISHKNLSCDIVVGWSLGAQTALRLLDAKLIRPKYMVLIATPFQMASSKSFKFAASKNKFDHFFQSFQNSPKLTLENFTKEVTAGLKNLTDQEYEQFSISNLTNWLIELGKASLSSLNFDSIKEQNVKIILIHGQADRIVSKLQSHHLAKILDCELHIFEGCGHAPHLERPDETKIILRNTISI